MSTDIDGLLTNIHDEMNRRGIPCECSAQVMDMIDAKLTAYEGRHAVIVGAKDDLEWLMEGITMALRSENAKPTRDDLVEECEQMRLERDGLRRNYATLIANRAPDPVREELVALLNDLQWLVTGDESGHCPLCHNTECRGHEKWCRIKLALQRTTP